MNCKSIRRALCGLACFALAASAMADGTEQLGEPLIDIAPGSQIVVAGVGLDDAQPDDINVDIPAGVDIAQILLYWSGRDEVDPGNDDTIEVNGEEVAGSRIGGPTTESGLYPSSAYRADITEMSDTNGWIVAGQVNVLTVGELDFGYSNDGAAVVVILDDGSVADIQIMDGIDWAWEPEDAQTMPITFPVDISEDPQVGTLWLIVGDVEEPRPSTISVIVDGSTNWLDNVLMSNAGNFIDVVELEVTVPPGATNVTVQLFSVDDDTDLLPASLAWSFVAWELAVPEDQGCTYTKGYWKNHPDDWPTDELSIFDGDDAMEILWMSPKKGNAWIILAHQYIAAELNVINGASIPTEVEDAWLDAQDLLLKYESEGTIPKKSEDREWAIYYAGMLDDYNNGILGPGHCDD